MYDSKDAKFTRKQYIWLSGYFRYQLESSATEATRYETLYQCFMLANSLSANMPNFKMAAFLRNVGLSNNNIASIVENNKVTPYYLDNPLHALRR